MKINAEALVARWELNGHNPEHPAYLIAKAIVMYDLDQQSTIKATRDWMYMGHYKGPYSWVGVQAVLDLYTTEVNE